MRTTLRLAAFAVAILALLAAPGASGPQPASARAPAHAATLTSSSHASAPAAAAPLNGCASGDFCVYELRGFGGCIYHWSGSDADWSNNYYCDGARVNNNDHGWTNNGTACAGCDHVRVFRYTNYGSPVTICLKRGQSVTAGPNNPAEGHGSSHSWYGSCP
jgi:Peptidase inhibitor family I36